MVVDLVDELASAVAQAVGGQHDVALGQVAVEPVAHLIELLTIELSKLPTGDEPLRDANLLRWTAFFNASDRTEIDTAVRGGSRGQYGEKRTGAETLHLDPVMSVA